MTSEEFVTYLNTNLLDAVPEIKEQINAEKWIYGSGLPENCPIIKSDRFEIAGKAAETFIAENSTKSIDTKGWTYQQWKHFLRKMPDSLSIAQMTALDKAYGFTKTGNNEVLFEWLKHVIKSEYKPGYKTLENFLVSIGRRKFNAPLFGELLKKENMHEWTKKVYQKAKPNYHFVATSTIEKMMAEANVEM